MIKIIDRLAEYIEKKGISLNSFDKSLGASNGYIGKQIKNRASIGGDVIEKISCIYTDLSMDWLITGKEPMLKENKAYREPDCRIDVVDEERLGLLKNCQLCNEKDKVIAAQQAQIATQGEYIELLKKK